MAQTGNWLATLARFVPTAGAAVAALVILAACALVGYSLLPRSWRGRSRLALPLALSVGITAVGWISWVVGATVGTVAILPICFALTLQALRILRGFVHATRTWLRLVWRLASSHPVLSVILAVTLLCLVPQLMLPVSDSDGLRYHLALPKLFLLTGKISYYPYEYTGALPQLSEMLYLLALELGRPECAKFLHAGVFVATLATLALSIDRGRATRAAAVMAPLAFAATPVALAVVAAAFVDHFAVFHCAVALLLASSGAQPAAVACALAGALGTKLTTGPFVAALWLVATLRAGRGFRLRSAVTMLIPISLVIFPFAVRNVVSTGDPIFPIGRVLLGLPVPGASAETVRFTTHYHADSSHFLGITWGASQGAVGLDEVAGWHNLLALFGLALAGVDRRLRLFAAPAAAYLVLGLWFHPPTRYLLPMFLCVAAIGAVALVRLTRRAAPWLGLALIAPALASSLSFVLTVFSPFDYILGRLDRSAFLARSVPGWRAAALVNAQPPGGVVMALGFPSPFYLDRPWIAEGMMVEPPLQAWVRSARNDQEVLHRLRAADVRFLLVSPTYGGGTPQTLLPLAHSRDALERVLALRTALRPIASLDGVDVFEIPPQPRARPGPAGGSPRVHPPG
ncbi:MAG: hypothetical protein ACHQQS_06450 [Thermoanaerobaculales bacterium]